VRKIDWDIIIQGEKGSDCLSCLQQLEDLAAGVIFFTENTNKLTELIVSVTNKTADFLTGINGKFLGLTKIKVKSYSTK